MANFRLYLLGLIWACSIAQAQTWVAFESTENTSAFMDADSLRPEGEKLLVWVLIDNLRMEREGKKVVGSTVVQHVVNCAAHEVGTRSVAVYPGHIGTGEAIESVSRKNLERMSEPPPGTIGQSIIKTACKLSKPERDLGEYQILLGQTSGALMTLGASEEQKDMSGAKKMAVVARTFYPKGDKQPEIASTCEGYLIDCETRAVVLRPPQVFPMKGRMCTGDQLGRRDNKPSPESWESNLVQKVCGASK